MFKLLVASLAIALYGVSNGHTMECSTPRDEIVFKLDESAITFYEKDISARSIASNVEATVFKKERSLTQYFDYKGLSHIIHIQDVKRPHAQEDYLLLENEKGERMLYSLSCKA